MKEADRLTIGRILKVNHAGEYGAIRIYRAQLFVASIPMSPRFLRKRWHTKSDTARCSRKQCRKNRRAPAA